MKLEQAEKAQKKDRTKALLEHLHLLQSNIKSMEGTLSKLQDETAGLDKITSVKQLVAHEKKMERYHATINKILEQIVRSQILTIKVAEQK
ncbi:MAG: hypothetical protein ACYCYP_01845 [Leptospirales bacterium]